VTMSKQNKTERVPIHNREAELKWIRKLCERLSDEFHGKVNNKVENKTEKVDISVQVPTQLNPEIEKRDQGTQTDPEQIAVVTRCGIDWGSSGWRIVAERTQK